MSSPAFFRLSATLLCLTLAACGGPATTNSNPGTGGEPEGDGGSGGGSSTGGKSGGTGGKTSTGGSPGTGGDVSTGGSMGTGGAGGGMSTGGSMGTGGAGDTGGAGGSGPIEPEPTEDLPPCKRTTQVPDSGALAGAIAAAMPGDCLVLADGNYTLPAITGKKGTAAAPIVIKAANTLKVVVASGGFSISDSAYVVVQGIMYTSNTGAKVNNCDHCRRHPLPLPAHEDGELRLGHRQRHQQVLPRSTTTTSAPRPSSATW